MCKPCTIGWITIIAVIVGVYLLAKMATEKGGV
jgi:hypothetical protein